MSLSFKRALLIFWGIWFLIVFATNLMDGLRTWGLIDARWPAVSDNFLYISKTTAIYRVPDWWNNFFFFSIVAWEAICAGLFLHASFHLGRSDGRSLIYRAFGYGIGLFATFILACEIFISYEMEGVHLRIFTAQLVSLLIVIMLPD